MLDINDYVPDFQLPATITQELSKKDLLGKYHVLYFYPKDNTPGCTTETKDFIALYDQFKELNCEIIGWNNNPMKLHDKFMAKHDIPFPLISDESLKSLEEFGNWQLKKFMGREYMGIVRSTFIIDSQAKIVKAYPKVRVKEHAQTVLNDLKELIQA
ncbi:peroxiredoxin [bacterium]|nr:peroxiredoxin [bacterium]